MALLLLSGAVTPGASVSNCRKLRVGRGNASKLRESIVDASSALSLRIAGGFSLTVISALLCATCNVALMILVVASATATSSKVAGLNPRARIVTAYVAGGSWKTE